MTTNEQKLDKLKSVAKNMRQAMDILEQKSKLTGTNDMEVIINMSKVAEISAWYDMLQSILKE